MKKYYLWLIMVFGYGNETLSELFDRFGTAEEIYNAFKENIASAGIDYSKKAEEISLQSAEELLKKISDKGISIITIDDELYPKELKSVPNPPIMLFARGNLNLLKGKLLTVSGSKKITPYTFSTQSAVCERLCRKYTLVSSLCEGCEQLACLTAIKCGAGCIEVLPCGLDVEYPKGSSLMRKQILTGGGLIISEFLPDVKTSHGNFLRRARISGGISKAMLIFQAGIKSGSLNAAKYSHALFFLPPNDIFAPEYAAAVKYVRNGASLYYSEEDLELPFSECFTENPITVPPKPVSKKAAPIKTNLKTKAEKPKKPETKKALPESTMPSEELFDSPVHYSVYRYIASAKQPITFDEIFRNVETEISELNEILLELEISDMIKAVAGSRYAVKNQSV